jgi:hypothetical protein
LLKAGGLVLDRQAYAYLILAEDRGTDETRLRRALTEYARRDGLDLCTVFVDRIGESPYGFAAMRELLRRRADVRVVVLPDLTHVAHIPTVAHLSRAGLARYLGTAVLLADCAART